jgi:hypothetical protein
MFIYNYVPRQFVFLEDMVEAFDYQSTNMIINGRLLGGPDDRQKCTVLDRKEYPPMLRGGRYCESPYFWNN